MKKHPLAFAGIAVLIFFAACKKDKPAAPARTIQYILYTKENFSTVHDTIRFHLLISSRGGKLFDSSLAAMTVSAIPDQLHEIVVNKLVPSGHDKDTLLVGFIYDIDNVGESWFLDSCLPGQTLKKVEYSFR